MLDLVSIYADRLKEYSSPDDTTITGRVREALLIHLLRREKRLTVYSKILEKQCAIMASGMSDNSQGLQSTLGKILSCLYPGEDIGTPNTDPKKAEDLWKKAWGMDLSDEAVEQAAEKLKKMRRR